MKKVSEVKDGDDTESITKEVEALVQVLQQIGQAAYAQEENPTDESSQDPESDSEAASEDKTTPDDEDVVDGEFKQV